MKAVLNAEGLEDRGAKASGSESWAGAAREALAAQRQLALLEAETNRLIASRDLDRARRTLDGLLAAGPGPKDDPIKAARAKAAAASRRGARSTRRVRRPQLAKAEAAVKAPLTTEYTPRPLEFPRAKTTYRDTPSNAPYSKVSTGRRLALARWIVDRRNPLTARVAVNHVWARHFGEPLVGSLVRFRPEDAPARTPRAARLAGRRVHGIGLEHQASASADRHLAGVPDAAPPTPAPATRTSPSTPTTITSGG